MSTIKQSILLIARSLLVLCSTIAMSQSSDIIMPSNNNFPGFEVITNSCGAQFYDSGGVNDDYGFAEDGKITICPANENEVTRVIFDEVYIAGNDFLYIYDGDTDQAPLITTITDRLDAPSGFFYASESNVSGCLTFVFTSSAQFANYEGWVARVDCYDPCVDLESQEISLSTCPNNGILTYDLSSVQSDLVGNLQNVSIDYYETLAEAEQQTNQITNFTDYSPPDSVDRIYVVLEIGPRNCSSISYFNLEIDNIPSIEIPASLQICNDDNIYSVNQLESLLMLPQDEEIVFYRSEEDQIQDVNRVVEEDIYTQNQLFYYRHTIVNGCAVNGFIQVDISTPAIIDLLPSYSLCGRESVEIDTGLDADIYTSSWYRNENLVAVGSQIVIEEEGEYELIIQTIDSDCRAQYSFGVDRGSTLLEDPTVTSTPFSRSVTINIDAASVSSITTRLDGQQASDNLVFNNLSNGAHTIEILGPGNCVVASLEFIINAPSRYFTPNSDGFNDRWTISNEDQDMQISEVLLFNRYGQLIKALYGSPVEWDGTSNGEPLPSNDYWFKINYVMDGIAGEATGHFTLKR